MKRKIVILDSDRQNARLLKNALTSENYEIFSVFSFSEGYSLISDNPPDVILIDPLYPEKDGIKFIKSLREWSRCVVIAVSSSAAEKAAVDILDAGADDYVRKPFYSGELAARVRAAVRQLEQLEEAQGADTSPNYAHGGLSVDFDRHCVTLNGQNIHLTKNEFKILELLCRYSGRVLTYDFIIKSIWGPQAINGNGILRVNVTNLRKKIEKDSQNPHYLFTENGIGYRAAENQPDDACRAV